MLARNAYLPVDPRIAARWGALRALLGGSLGVAYSVAYTLLTNGSTPDGAAAWWDHAPTGQILFWPRSFPSWGYSFCTPRWSPTRAIPAGSRWRARRSVSCRPPLSWRYTLTG